MSAGSVELCESVASATRQITDSASRAHYISPAWVALDASRGIETPGSKLFMRLTVVFWDLLVYIPALIMFVRTWQGTRSQRTQEQAFLVLLLQPALLLVDHGHFQYNSVMLGKFGYRQLNPLLIKRCRLQPSFYKLPQSRPRCLWSDILCTKPWIQTNGSVLLPCYRRVSVGEVHLLGSI